MNRKGFTLVELMAVIAILGIILLIAVPSYLGVSKKIKEDMWDNKMKMIETAVEMWVQDNKNYWCEYSNTQKKWVAKQYLIDNCINNNKCPIQDFIGSGYLKADKSTGEFIDPRTNKDVKGEFICGGKIKYSNNENFYFCNNNSNSEGYRGVDKLCK